MPLYKFYRIVPKDVSKTDCYIGHTIQPLRKRFSQHWEKRNNVGACMTAKMFECHGRDGLQIVLIHELELATIEEARKEERRLYEENKATVVNKVRPYTYVEEQKKEAVIRAKKWVEANKERSQEWTASYRTTNALKLRDMSRKYSQEHREENRVRCSAWYEANKERANTMMAKRKAYDAGLKYFARISLE